MEKIKNPPVRDGSLWRYKRNTLAGQYTGGKIFEVKLETNSHMGSLRMLIPAHKNGWTGEWTNSHWINFTNHYRLANFARVGTWQHLQG